MNQEENVRNVVLVHGGLIRRLLDFRQFKRAARHLYPNLPRNMLAKYGSDCGWIRKGPG